MKIVYPEDADVAPNSENQVAEHITRAIQVSPNDLVVVIVNGRARLVTVETLVAGGFGQPPPPPTPGISNFLLDGIVDPDDILSTVNPPSDPTKTWHYTNTVTRSTWTWPKNGPAWLQVT